MNTTAELNGYTADRFRWVEREHTINNDDVLRVLWTTAGTPLLSACCVRALIREVLAARASGYVHPRKDDGDPSLSTAWPGTAA